RPRPLRIKQRRGHARRLACTGWSHEHRLAARHKRRFQFREDFVDRKHRSPRLAPRPVHVSPQWRGLVSGIGLALLAGAKIRQAKLTGQMLAVLAVTASVAACGTTGRSADTRRGVTDAAYTPLRDVNMIRPEVPLLLRNLQYPYATADLTDCSAI